MINAKLMFLSRYQEAQIGINFCKSFVIYEEGEEIWFKTGTQLDIRLSKYFFELRSFLMSVVAMVDKTVPSFVISPSYVRSEIGKSQILPNRTEMARIGRNISCSSTDAS